MAPLNVAAVDRLPLEELVSIDFSQLTNLEHLSFIEHGLLLKFDPIHDFERASSILSNLPKTLRQLCVVPLDNVDLSLPLATSFRLQNELSGFLPALESYMVYCPVNVFGYLINTGGATTVAVSRHPDDFWIERVIRRAVYGLGAGSSPQEVLHTSRSILEDYCVHLMFSWHFQAQVAASAFDVGLTITATDGASIVKKNPREPFSSLTNDCLRLVLFFVQERHVIPSSSVLPNPFVKTPNPLPMDTMAAQGSHIRVSTSVWAADQGEGSLDLPTELVRPIAAELPANDIARSSASCRKVYQDVKPVISGSIPTVMHSMDPKLSLLARSCRKE
ncbi:hypothetical protein IWX50DRAFT_658156 [Phyllosticta citricarpa]